jgi:hypothetical protein
MVLTYLPSPSVSTTGKSLREGFPFDLCLEVQEGLGVTTSAVTYAIPASTLAFYHSWTTSFPRWAI